MGNTDGNRVKIVGGAYSKYKSCSCFRIENMISHHLRSDESPGIGLRPRATSLPLAANEGLLGLATSRQGGNVESSRTRYGPDEAHVHGTVIDEQTSPFLFSCHACGRPGSEAKSLGPEWVDSLRLTLKTRHS